MPREISTRHDLYSSFPDQTHDLVYAHHSPADSTSEPASPSDASSPASASGQKKKHVCNTCGRAFSTSGHLARHARVHTGERNHKCPFPGCQTRCSRQDNLQQHYRIHLSPGSRRGSGAATRAAIRAMKESDGDGKKSRSYRRSNPLPSLQPPHIARQQYEQARAPSITPPPDTPPPLAPARFPGMHHASSSSSSSSSSPDLQFSSHAPIFNAHPVAISPNSPHDSLPHLSDHYRTGAVSYEQHSPVLPPLAYAELSDVQQSSIGNPGRQHFAVAPEPDYGYPEDSQAPHLVHAPVAALHESHRTSHLQSPEDDIAVQPQFVPIAHTVDHHYESDDRLGSRYTVSRVPHPHHSSYPPTPTTGSPSPVSSHSRSSHPSEPTSPVYLSPTTNLVIQTQNLHRNHSLDSSTLSAVDESYCVYSPQGDISPEYPYHHSQPGTAPPSRYNSPPLTLAPIHDERVVRGDQSRTHSYLHQPQHHHTYMASHHYPDTQLYHPQPMMAGSNYQTPLVSLAHGSWKMEAMMRARGAVV